MHERPLFHDEYWEYSFNLGTQVFGNNYIRIVILDDISAL
jgi:hypothetical protein